MATAGKNLSDYDSTKIPNGSTMTLGIVVSEWNEEITSGLLNGALEILTKHKVAKENIELIYVPGAFELPLGAQLLLQNKELDAIICLGCVIQGETKHFDFVCEGVTQGIKDVSLKFNKPVIFGVLTDNTKQQSIDRSGGKHGNKGDEAAITALKMISLQKKLTHTK